MQKIKKSQLLLCSGDGLKELGSFHMISLEIGKDINYERYRYLGMMNNKGGNWKAELECKVIQGIRVGGTL